MNSEFKTKFILFLAAFVLYVQTVDYDYALDDKIVAANNQITKRGFDGMFLHFKHDAMDGFWAEEYGVPVEELNKAPLVSGGRYRPLTLITHSIEWALFGNSPGLGHFVNTLIYGLLVLFIYLWLRSLLKEEKSIPFWRSTAFWASLLFAAHPLHTEVVANIKGRDEILGFMFASAAMYQAQKAYDNNRLNDLWKPSMLLFLSFLSKESTVTFVAVWPASLFFFRSATLTKALKWGVIPVIVALVYLAVRQSVINSGGEPTQLMNNPFLWASESEKFATVFLTVAAYLKLNFWPWPLTHDYYPFHLPFMPDGAQYPEWSHPAVLIGLLLFATLAAVAVIGTFKRDRRVFGILLFFITFLPVSNILFPVGVFMNERFMFIPSLGIILTVLLTVRTEHTLRSQSAKKFIVPALLIAIIFGAVTVIRNQAWRNDSTLALTDAATSKGSAKAQMSAGDAYLKQVKEENNPQKKSELIKKCYEHLNRSLEIHPDYFPPHDLMGQLYFYAERYEESVKWFDRCARMKPGRPQFTNNMFAGAIKLKDNEEFDKSLAAFNMLLERDPQQIRALENAAEIYARRKGNTETAFQYLQRALEIEPQNAGLHEKTGIVFAMNNQFERAFEYFDKAESLAPRNPSIIKNKGITYMQLGNEEEGRKLLQKAERLEQNAQQQ